MKKIKIIYEEINLETTELMIMSISIDKEFKKKAKLYLYELGSIEGLSKKLEEYLNSDKYIKSPTYLEPIFLNLTNDEYVEVVEYLKEPTVYEEVMFQDDVKFLNARISLLKQDVKFWET